MGFIGVQPATVPLTANDITDGIITTAKIADDAITAGKLPSGTVIQTVFSRVAVQQTITSSTYADIPNGGHQITITPLFANSKILINFLGSRQSYSTTNGISYIQMHRSIDGGSFSFLEQIESQNYTQGAYGYSRSQAVFDSPSTTTAVIYKMMAKSTGTGNAHYGGYDNVPATLTALEIKQ